jgi:hypothetical protein
MNLTAMTSIMTISILTQTRTPTQIMNVRSATMITTTLVSQIVKSLTPGTLTVNNVMQPAGLVVVQILFSAIHVMTLIIISMTEERCAQRHVEMEYC